MFYLYALKSLRNGDLYIGFTHDLRNRLQEHNEKKVKSTGPNTPWELVYYEAYKSKVDATRRERQLKEHKPKSDLMKQIQDCLAEE